MQIKQTEKYNPMCHFAGESRGGGGRTEEMLLYTTATEKQKFFIIKKNGIFEQ